MGATKATVTDSFQEIMVRITGKRLNITHTKTDKEVFFTVQQHKKIIQMKCVLYCGTEHFVSEFPLETSLVSTNLIHDAQHGTSLLLECRAIPEHVPLDYCRFVLPDGTGFSINEKTTANKSVFRMKNEIRKR